MILAIDVGGTKVDVALVLPDLEIVDRKRFSSADYSSLETVLEEFLKGRDAPCRAVCAGVAGPVKDNVSELTNLSWTVSADGLKRAAGADHAWVINDLEASAWGALNLDTDGVRTLNPGKLDDEGNRALISSGTGLGQAIMFWDGQTHLPSASEGGHCDFAPANTEDLDLLRYLFTKYDHVSWERVVSGKFGFQNLYEFLCHQGKVQRCEILDKSVDSEGFGRAVYDAVGQDSSAARMVLKYFFRYLGAEAGNIALKSLATGGVFLGGGIVPKLLEHIETSEFLDAFFAKGRISSILPDIPIHVIVDSDCAIKGAAACAISRLPVG